MHDKWKKALAEKAVTVCSRLIMWLALIGAPVEQAFAALGALQEPQAPPALSLSMEPTVFGAPPTAAAWAPPCIRLTPNKISFSFLAPAVAGSAEVDGQPGRDGGPSPDPSTATDAAASEGAVTPEVAAELEAASGYVRAEHAPTADPFGGTGVEPRTAAHYALHDLALGKAAGTALRLAEGPRATAAARAEIQWEVGVLRRAFWSLEPDERLAMRGTALRAARILHIRQVDMTRHVGREPGGSSQRWVSKLKQRGAERMREALAAARAGRAAAA